MNVYLKTDLRSFFKGVFLAVAVAVTALMFSTSANALEITPSDQQFLKENFEGVWRVNGSKELIRIRSDEKNLIVLVGMDFLMAEENQVVDIDRAGKAVTLRITGNPGGHLTMTRFLTSMQVSTDLGTSTAIKTRRLIEVDSNVIDAFLYPPTAECQTEFDWRCRKF